MKKRFLSLLVAASMVFSIALTGCGNSNTSSTLVENTTTENITEAPTTEVEETTVDRASLPMEERIGFHVDGTKLLDANGNPFIMRGVNHAYTWFSDKSLVVFDVFKDMGFNTVRLVLSDGVQWTETRAEMVSTLIKFCKERNMIAVLEVHDATGKNDVDSLIKAAEYFVKVKDALIGEEDYAIINIANEWDGFNESKKWREAYLQAVPMLRDAGLANTIMIDSSGWGQYAKCIESAGAEILEADVLKNTMFSIHMYGTAGGSEEKIEKNIKYATDNNLCVCIGEFGYKHSDGDVKEDFLMKYCVENEIGYMAWSWKGNGGDVAYLDLAKDWNGKQLTEEWGEMYINGPNGIKETSKICTVFE